MKMGKWEGAMRKWEGGLWPGGAMGAYAPEGMRQNLARGIGYLVLIILCLHGLLGLNPFEKAKNKRITIRGCNAPER